MTCKAAARWVRGAWVSCQWPEHLPPSRVQFLRRDRTESTAPAGSDLGVDGLERYVAECAHQPLEDFVESIRQRFEQFRGGVRADDDERLLAIAHREPDE